MGTTVSVGRGLMGGNIVLIIMVVSLVVVLGDT